jgi:hypothetical protein
LANAYFAGMDREYWIKKLRDAEAELEAARRRSEVDDAAAKLQRAKTELRALEAERMKPKVGKRGAQR